MTGQFGEYTLDTDIDRIQFERVHAWLSSSYWSPGIERDKVEKAARNSSFVVGVYLGSDQVGYLRIISDRTTFGWVCDVWVDESSRKKGIAKEMVRFALSHPDHQNMRRWVLATKDAHEIYRACGFEPIPMPERWMALYTVRPS